MGTYAYVNPVIAVLLDWLVLSEDVTATVLIGTAVIVASVAMIVRNESRGDPASRPAAAPVARAAPERQP